MPTTFTVERAAVLQRQASDRPGRVTQNVTFAGEDRGRAVHRDGRFGSQSGRSARFIQFQRAVFDRRSAVVRIIGGKRHRPRAVFDELAGAADRRTKVLGDSLRNFQRDRTGNAPETQSGIRRNFDRGLRCAADQIRRQGGAREIDHAFIIHKSRLNR